MRAGQIFVVEVYATPSAVLDGGKITMVVKAMGVTVSSRAFGICEDIDLTCPVAPEQSVRALFRFPVPWYAITMRADVVITATDTEGSPLACVEAPQIPVVRKGHIEPVLSGAGEFLGAPSRHCAGYDGGGGDCMCSASSPFHDDANRCHHLWVGKQWCLRWHDAFADLLLSL